MASEINVLAQFVKEWADETFPNRTDASMYLKLYGEIGEMVDSNGRSDEIADVFIMLLDYAARKGINIEYAVRWKMAINKNRKWKIDANGVARHV